MSKKEETILKHSMGLFDTVQLSYEKIAKKFCLSTERIKQIERGAIKRLKRKIGRDSCLKEYLREGINLAE